MDDIQEDGSSMWTIKSGANYLQYTILKQASKCLDEACQLKCKECNICIHQFICDCPDSLIHNTICKHVHLLQRHLKDASKFEINTNYKEFEVKQTMSNLQERVCSQDVQVACQTLQDTLRLFADELDKCENKDLLNEITKKVKASHLLYTSLHKQESLTPIKKINPQLRFRSTKKKGKKLPKYDLPSQIMMTYQHYLEMTAIVSDFFLLSQLLLMMNFEHNSIHF